MGDVQHAGFGIGEFPDKAVADFSAALTFAVKDAERTRTEYR